MVIPWGNDSGFTFQQGKPSLRANEITGLKSHSFEWGRAPGQLCMAPGFGNSCSAWLCWLLPFENEKQRSKIQFPQYAGGLWDVSRGKLFLLSVCKCPTLRVFFSFFFSFFVSCLPPAWLGTTFSLGPWRSQIPDGGHRSGSPRLSPCPWDWEFIYDGRPGQDLE